MCSATMEIETVIKDYCMYIYKEMWTAPLLVLPMGNE